MTFLALIFLTCSGFLAFQLWKKNEEKLRLEAAHSIFIEQGRTVLKFLHDVGEAFDGSLKRDEIFKLIIQCAVRTSGAKSGAIFLLDPSNQFLEASVIEGPFPPPIRPSDHIESKLTSRAVFLEQTIMAQQIKMGEGILGTVAQNGKLILVKNALEDDRLPHYENEILKIHTYLAVPLIFRDQILGVLALANTKNELPFSDADVSLATSIASQVSFVIYNTRLQQVMAEKERLDRDLEIAREIQQILLPSNPPHIEGVDVSALNVPAQEVGGDYYDFIPIDQDHWGFAIADVSGKGVSGALIMAMCRSALRSKAMGNPSPKQVLSQVNRVMHPDMREDMFIAMDYGILNIRTLELSFCRSGHEPLIIHRSDPSRVEILAPRGMALGIDSGAVFDTALQEQKISLKKGDILVFYTDGITEALNEEGEEFDRDKLIEAIESCACQTAQEMARNIEERVRRFIGSRAQNDDITILVVRI